MRVRIHRLSPAVRLPEYHSRGAAAFDLSASADVTVTPGEVTLVPTGLVVEVPAGFFLAIVARSSLPIRKRLMVANGVGVVDSDYCGPGDEVKVEVYNFGSEPVTISAGERIAQGLVLPAVRVEWEEVGATRQNARGGFGATGGYDERR